LEAYVSLTLETLYVDMVIPLLTQHATHLAHCYINNQKSQNDTCQKVSQVEQQYHYCGLWQYSKHISLYTLNISSIQRQQ